MQHLSGGKAEEAVFLRFNVAFLSFGTEEMSHNTWIHRIVRVYFLKIAGCRRMAYDAADLSHVAERLDRYSIHL
jgi:hypothetical protein